MADVVCFGELLLRLTAADGLRLGDCGSLEATFGGAEANAAVQLIQLGRSVSFVSRVPANELAVSGVEKLRGRGVEVKHVQTGGDRLGIYFVEIGASQRPSKVVYDRKGSAFSEIRPGTFDWEEILAGAKWLHWSGITPALSEGCAAVCREVCEAAKAKDITISFDVNYRSKLWPPTEASATLLPLMHYVDVCVCGEDEAVQILGADTMAEEDAARLPAVAASLAKRHGFRTVAMTSRLGTSATATRLRGILLTAGVVNFSREHDITVMDRFGTGDAFSAGLIFSLMRGDAPDAAIEFATAASVWKHTVPGDWTRCTLDEIESLAGGGNGARIQR